MKKYKNISFYWEAFVFFCFFFGIEIIFRVVEGFSLFDYATLRILLSSFFFAFFIEFVLSFIKNQKVRKGISTFVLFLISIYAWGQAGFKNFLGIFISVGTSSQMSAVLSYVKEFLFSYKWEYYLIFLPFLLYLLYLKLPRKEIFEGNSRSTLSFKMISFGCILVLGIFYGCTLIMPFFQNPMQLVSNKTLFLVPTNSSIAVNQFGTSVFAILDIKNRFFPVHLVEYQEHGEEKEEKFDDVAWKKIIDEETDSSKNTLNRYFIGRDIHEKNDYTGYFKGKNLIVIMLESVNNAILNEKYFPNFAKMLKNGWYWENNYSPRNACPTGDNEFSGMTSLYPVNTSCTVNTYPDNTYFEAIFNRFNEKKYVTSSYHNLDDTYYLRSSFHKNMGSLEYYDANHLNISINPSDFTEWPSDVELIEKSSKIFTKDSPFMVWMTTVTAHQPYDVSSLYGDYYLDLFDDTDYSITLKRYLSKLKVTDDALGKLLEILEEKNILDDTVIVLYGDHYPYGLSDSDVSRSVTYDIKEFYERERTPFLIYNNELESEVFEEKTFYMNLVPTILNLFGLDYDSRLYLGEDLFDKNYSSRVVFADGSWEDGVARYNAAFSSIEYFTPEITYTLDEIKKINYDIYQKKEMSKLAITANYFEYLNELMQEASKTESEKKNE